MASKKLDGGKGESEKVSLEGGGDDAPPGRSTKDECGQPMTWPLGKMVPNAGRADRPDDAAGAGDEGERE